MIILLVIAICICPALCQSAKPQSINVSVDPRIELLAAVQLLSGYGDKYGLITRHDFPYKQDVAEYFAPYKGHRVVKLFAEMSNQGFSFDAPPAAMLYLSDPPNLRQRVPFFDYIKKRAGGERQLNDFVQALRAFARETNFTAFFNAHKGTYRAIVLNAKKELKGADWIGSLEDYYGTKQASYNIILVPLFHPGGFGPRLERTDGKYDIFNIGGPMDARDGWPVFGTKESFKQLAWHEFGHSFANLLGEKYDKELQKCSSLFDPIEPKMREQAYGRWLTCVNEHVVRAVKIRLAVADQGKDGSEGLIDGERAKGFAYIKALCRKLEEYEKQRDKYPTFESFYPELVAVFKSLSEQKLGPEFYLIPFRGSIKSVARDKQSVLIVPTHEADADVQDEIRQFVQRVRDQFYKESPILTDDEALKQDLSDKAVVAYGTMTGNSWLASLSGGLPFKIEPKQVVADTAYPGQHLRFITAWPNPRNPKKGILIYTAQQAADVVGINSVFHGPTDYVVARDKEVLKAADYVKKNGRWTFR